MAACLLVAGALTTARVAQATSFTAGQNAAVVLGAADFTTPAKGTKMDRSFDRPAGLMMDANGRVLVAEEESNRVSVFNAMPTTNGGVIDRVIGNASKQDYRSGCSTSRVMGAVDVWSSGSRVAVAPKWGGRVLLFDTFPTVDGAAASRVLGNGTCSNYAAPTAGTIGMPGGVWTNGTKVMVADSYNNRVLIWNSWPTADGQAADLVLGQTSMIAGAADDGAASASTMHSPGGVWSDGTRILVADRRNNRVLVWDSWPTANGQAASRVIGQSSFSGETAVACDGANLDYPVDVSSNGTRIVVSDGNRDRVLLYDSWPTANGATASRVLGQSGTGACSRNHGSTALDSIGFGGVQGVWTNGTTVLVSESNRVLAWNSWPSTNGQVADRVLGQPSFEKGGRSGMDRESVFHYPFYWETAQLNPANWVVGVWPHLSPDGSLWVGTGRVQQLMKYSSAPTVNNAPPTWIFGQRDASHNFWWGSPNHELTAGGTGHPTAVWSDGTRLIAVDNGAHRVKIWNTNPTMENQAPDIVLGQTAFNTASPGTTRSTLRLPMSVASDGTRIAVTDHANNRVLIWNSWPTTNGQAADLVLGQPDFTSSVADNPAAPINGLGPQSLDGPMGVAMWNGKLAIADQNNHRVLIWNRFPSASNTPADAVYGQSDLYSATEGAARQVKGVALADNTLFFTQRCSAKYLDPIPLTTAATGAVDIGTGCSAELPTASGLLFPTGITARAGTVWVSDDQHARLLRFNDTTAPTITVAPAVVPGCRSAKVRWSTSESGTSEVYWGTASQATPGAYPNNSISTAIVGLKHARTISGLAPGTYYYRVQTKDGSGLAVFSAEATFTIAPNCPTSQYTHDTNASAGSVNPSMAGLNPIRNPDPRLSWLNNAGATVDRQRVQAVTTPLDDVVALWHLDGSTADASDEPKPMTLAASPKAPSYATGQTGFGQSLAFDGVDDWASVPHDPAFDLTSFTVEAWFRTPGLTNSYPQIVNKGTANDNRNFQIYAEPSAGGTGQLHATFSAGGTAHYFPGGVPLPALADNRWHHVALVVDSAAGAARLYVDGTERNALTFTGTVDTPASALEIGGYGNSTGAFKGSIDEIRISSVARSAAQIAGYFKLREPHYKELWDSDAADAGLVMSGCAAAARCSDIVYGSSASAAALGRDGARYHVRAKYRTTAGTWTAWSGYDWFEADVAPPAAQFANDTDASTGAVNPSIAGGTAITSATPHLSWKNESGTTVNRQRTKVVTTPLNDVTGLWHLDGDGDDVSDGARTLAPAAAPNDPAYAPGQSGFGSALEYDADDRAMVPASSAFDLQTFTVDLWFRTSSIAGSDFPNLAIKGNTWNNRNFNIFFARDCACPGPALGASLSAGGTYAEAMTAATPYVDGQWHHVAIVVGGGTLRLYVDGAQRASTAFTGTVDTPSAEVGVGGNGFVGSIDELRISSVARSAAEISGYYSTRLPHYREMWDSDPTDAGAALATCGAGVRCADVIYGTGGSASTPLVREGARYYARTKLRSSTGAWGPWSSHDWFETRSTITVTVPSGSAVSMQSMPGQDTTATSTVNVTTPSATGYTLLATASSDAGMSGPSGATIPPWTAIAPAAPTSWPSGTTGHMGLSVLSATGGKDTTRWGTGSVAGDDAGLKYVGLQSSASAILFRRDGYSSSTDAIETTYRVSPTLAQAPGSYSTTITYTATANP